MMSIGTVAMSIYLLNACFAIFRSSMHFRFFQARPSVLHRPPSSNGFRVAASPSLLGAGGLVFHTRAGIRNEGPFSSISSPLL